MYVIGIDVGTQGVRVMIVNTKGEVIAEHRAYFHFKPYVIPVNAEQAVCSEQDPRLWWQECVNCLNEVTRAFSLMGHDADEIAALSVASTSGTVLLIDSAGEPLSYAFMYNDSRARHEAQLCNEAAESLSGDLGYRFAPSFGLPKILRYERIHQGEIPNESLWIHATDYIIGKLTGDFRVTDETSALKSGYDARSRMWREDILSSLGISNNRLPRVVQSGFPIGTVSRSAACDTGLSTKTIVTSGMTDGCASQLASGAAKPGEWTSTLGTTLVLKGVSERFIFDPDGLIYNHRHPMGLWMVGAASNTGGEALDRTFGRSELAELDTLSKNASPSSLLVYPLVRRGERFPFLNANARGFEYGVARTQVQRYVGFLEGVAYIERLCYERIDELTVRRLPWIYVSGSAANSHTWLQIRSNVLNTELRRPRHVDGAMGAAILASSQTVYADLEEAVRQMVRISEVVVPDSSLTNIYNDLYSEFKERIQEMS